MSVDLKNSETLKNLMRAFAGESQARNRYTFAASVCRQQKLHVVEAVFRFTADQEKEHAEIFYNHMKELAGQTVAIAFNLGQVYVDGELLDEDYINDYTYREEGTVFPLTVPEGEVFLMGDNRNHSNDSRDSSLGTVDTRLLIGKAVFLVFPGRDYLTEQREFGRIGLLQ